MKVLLVHNFYGSNAPSGENVAYMRDVELLRKFGHEVSEFTTSSDELRTGGITGAIRGAGEFMMNPGALRKLRALVRERAPDILHVHNVFPRLSPLILSAASGTGTATVHTLHNYRLFCSAGTATRAGRACKECADVRSVMPALRYRCYRQSLAATAAVALSIAGHRAVRTLPKNVDAFITLTEFQRDLFSGAGYIPLDRTYVRPNFMPAKDSQPLPFEGRPSQVVYVGRLSEEKGPAVAVEAWRRLGDDAPKLLVVGDGPDRARLEAAAGGLLAAGRVEFTGRLSPERTLGVLRESRALVLPSLCFEGFPMVIPEAFALGVPVVASALGALPSLVRDRGLTFQSGDADALAAAIRSLWKDEAGMAALSAAAHAAYHDQYSEAVALDSLIRIYTAAGAHKLRAAAERRPREDQP